MGKKIVEYDEIKRMLNTLRRLNEAESPIVTPQVNQEEPQSSGQFDDIAVVNDVEVKSLSNDKSDLMLTDDKKKALSQFIDNFKQQVSQIVEFEPGFTINYATKEVRLDGHLTDEDFSFTFVLGKDGGLYIDSDMTKLDDNVTIAIDKLKKLEEPFKTLMTTIITYENVGDMDKINDTNNVQ